MSARNLESAARELLRLDAEATAGPWGVTHRLRICAVDERGEPRPRTGMRPTGDPFPNVGASGLPSAGEAVFAPARDYATDEANVTLIAFARNTAPALARAYLAVCKVLEDNGCDCDCEHHPEEHDDDCVRCLACRVELAMLHAAPPAPYATAREAFGVGR